MGESHPRESASAARARAGLAFLVGPTAVGKTAVGILVARALNAEILSIDSRQAYRGLDVGTAKPSAAERTAAAHHLLDLFDPREKASAQVFAEHFRDALEDLGQRGCYALAVGGSGLYVDACLGRLDPLPAANAAIRRDHERIAEQEGPQGLHRRLRAVDPDAAALLAPQDLQRVSRALEVHALTGQPLSSLQKQRGPLDLSAGPAMVVLTRERSDLHARIAARALEMVAHGLRDEVEELLAAGVPAQAPGFEGIGYGEFARAVHGEITFAQAVEAFVRRTRQYAKRQETWFRNRYRGTHTLAIAAGEDAAQIAARVLAALAARPGP